jgi:signal transduction histidine kinase
MTTPEPATPHRFRLRRLMVILSACLTTLTAVACVSLAVLTHVNERHTERLMRAARASDAAHTIGMQLQRFNALSNYLLLTRETSREPERSKAMEAVYQSIGVLGSSIDPSRHAEVDEVAAEVRRYLDARHTQDIQGSSADTAVKAIMPEFDSVYRSLDAITARQAAELTAEEAYIARWNAIVEDIGWAIAIVVILASVACVGMYRAIFVPMLGLADLLRRFTNGERDLRARPGRALELATAGDAYNEMADAITGQHGQMAEFLAQVASDLREPMHVMQMSLGDLTSAPPPGLDARAKARLVAMSRALDRLDARVESFLDVSRVEWQRLDLQQPSRDLRPAVARVAKIYEALSSIHQIALDLPEGPVCVRFEQGRLSQVLHTLLACAIQLSPRGGVVTVSLAKEAHDSHEQAVLTVTDHGGGIPEQELRRLLDSSSAFRRIAGMHLPGSGTTVAISVARRIVAAHGGQIEAESKVGEGTTLRMRLPLAHPDQPARLEARHDGDGVARHP